MNNARHTLAEQSGGRFMLGLGVSHGPFVEGVMGREYGKPVATMRDYLQRMRASAYQGPRCPDQPSKSRTGALTPSDSVPLR